MQCAEGPAFIGSPGGSIRGAFPTDIAPVTFFYTTFSAVYCTVVAPEIASQEQAPKEKGWGFSFSKKGPCLFQYPVPGCWQGLDRSAPALPPLLLLGLSFLRDILLSSDIKERVD
jgi:hypothetical protein